MSKIDELVEQIKEIRRQRQIELNALAQIVREDSVTTEDWTRAIPTAFTIKDLDNRENRLFRELGKEYMEKMTL